MPSSVASALALVIQIFVAVVLFVAIGAAAVTLNVLIGFCDAHKLAPEWVLFGMRALEMLLWAADAVCCAFLVVREAWVFCATVLAGRQR